MRVETLPEGPENVPLLKSIQFPPSVPALVGSGAPAVSEISVDSLFSEHRQKRSERWGRKTPVE